MEKAHGISRTTIYEEVHKPYLSLGSIDTDLMYADIHAMFYPESKQAEWVKVRQLANIFAPEELGSFIGPGNRVFENVPYIDCIAKGPIGRKWVSIELTYHRFSQIGGQSHWECLEQLGSFDPIPNQWGQKVCGLNVERIKYWIACGCHLTDASARVLGLAGITPLSPETVFQAKKLKDRKEIEQRAGEWVRKNVDSDN